MTLTEFLLARIAEDEAVAHGATGGPWRYDPTKVNRVDGGEAVFAGPRGLAATTVASVGPADDPQSMADGAHIALHGPSRVLAECEAKRRIVEMMQSAIDGAWQSPSRVEIEFVATRTMRFLALPYADHPDYDPSWEKGLGR